MLQFYLNNIILDFCSSMYVIKVQAQKTNFTDT